MPGIVYPLLDLFWTLLQFAVLVLWVALIVLILGDVFHSADLSGLAKALWTLLVLAMPWLGALVYLVIRGDSMPGRWRSAHRRPRRSDVYAPPTGRSSAPWAGGGISGPTPM
jgi:phospholipase D-like protein